MDLIPLPRKIITHSGVFSILHDTAIILDLLQDDIDFETAKLLQREIKDILALKLIIKKGVRIGKSCNENCICFEYEKTNSNDESYRLIITPKKISIYSSGNRGFLYGAATLIQMCKIKNGEIPCSDIFDTPSYAYRGYMLDVSRGRVPTMKSLKAMIDKLALYKINQLQLYMENCLRLDGFEEVWSYTNPFMPEEILELDYYCHLRGIELVPCVATFGHLYDLLGSVSFSKYRETDKDYGGVFTWNNRLRCYTINVSDPESYKFVTGILDQVTPLFRSNKINISCDETFELGKGKSAHLAGTMSYGELYILYVNKLVEYLQSKGKEVMIWADILRQNPDAVDKLNKDVTCLNWYYNYGVKEEIFEIFEANNICQYVCPSVSGYSRLVNDYDLSFSNIKEMAEKGKKHRAVGFLNTDWGDCGHINMPALNIPCMIYGAAKAWNVHDMREEKNIDHVISLQEYGDGGKNLAAILRELSHQDIITFNDLVYFRDFKIFKMQYEENGEYVHEKVKNKIMQTSETKLKAAVKNCGKIIQRLKKNYSKSAAGKNNEIIEFYLACRGVSLIQELALVLKKWEYGQDITVLDTPNEIAAKLENWLVDYSDDWRAVSRESELFRIKEFFWQVCYIVRKYA